jgi:hypothetical protein
VSHSETASYDKPCHLKTNVDTGRLHAGEQFNDSIVR